MVIESKRRNITNNEIIAQGRPSKLLSICTIGRDDDYTADFRYRVTTTINHFARSVKNLERHNEVEIVVTDWGSQIPMSQTLELLPAAAKICRFVYVPPDVVRSTQKGSDDFHTTRSLNVALRRACGRFLLITGADEIMQQHSLNTILCLLDGRLEVPINVDHCLLMVPRLEVPWQFIERRPSLHEWDRYMLLNEYSLERRHVPYLNFFSWAGGLMLYRDLYYELGVFDEAYGGWGGSDIDLGLRASQNFPFLWLSSVGVFMFHMGHPPTGRRQLALTKANTLVYTRRLKANDDSWGLRDYNFEVQQVRHARFTSDTDTELDRAEDGTFRRLLSSSDIYEQLQHRDVEQHVKRIVSMLIRNGRIVERKDLGALYFLSWYSIYHFPRRYVEFGVRKLCGAAVVAGACPSAEVYLVDQWEGPMAAVKADPVGLAGLLYRVGLRGYLRFVNGEVTTALKRLQDSFMGPFEFDLALIRGETFGTTAAKQVCDLAHFMKADGALVLTCETEPYYLQIWNELQHMFPKFRYLRCRDGRTGMALSCSTSDMGSWSPENIQMEFPDRWFSLLVARSKIAHSILKPLVPIVSRFTQILEKCV